MARAGLGWLRTDSIARADEDARYQRKKQISTRVSEIYEIHLTMVELADDSTAATIESVS